MKALICSLLLASAAFAQVAPPWQDTNPDRFPEHLRGKLGTVGNEDNLGTLPLNSSASGGGAKQDEGGAGAGGAEPNSTRTAKAVAVEPCSTGENGGTAASNGCSSEGSVIIKSNGDATLMNGTEGAVVECGSSNDSVIVGANCTASVTGPASSVHIASWNTEVYVTNTSSSTGMPVMVQGVPAILPPGQSHTYTTPTKPVN